MSVDPATVAVKVALMAAQMAFTATRKIEGPRLDSLDVTLAEYGTPLPFVWGSAWVPFHIIWAKKLNEKKVETKTKGGKFEEYKYDFTCAAQGCENPLDAIAKLKFDNKLVFDLTNAGPVAPFFGAVSNSGVKLRAGHNLRIYLGSETQMPDPAYEEWCEDRYGPDSAPAFRGEPYLVLESIPAEPWGNRIPQIRGLCINSASASFPSQTVDAPETFVSPQITLNGSTLFSVAGTSFMAWDLPTRTLLTHRTLPVSVDWPNAVGDDAVYAIGGAFSREIYRMGLDGSQVKVVEAANNTFVGTSCAMAGGQVYIFPTLGSTEAFGVWTGGSTSTVTVTANYSPTMFFSDVDGGAVGIGLDGAGGTGFYVDEGANGSGTHISTASTEPPYGYDAGAHYVVRQEGVLYTIAKGTPAIIASRTVAGSANPYYDFVNTPPGAATFWEGGAERSSDDLANVRTITFSDWTLTIDGTEGTIHIYDPVSHAIIGFTNGPEIVWRYLDRVTNGGSTLGQITTDVCTRRNVDNIDLGSLGSITVQGYTAIMGSGREQLEPLYDIHDVDPVPHDFGILFKIRGSSATELVTDEEMVREEGALWLAPITPDRELPYAVTITYADEETDQGTNTVRSSRFGDTADTTNIKAIDGKTWVSDPEEAQPLADRLFRRMWGEREKPEFTLKVGRSAFEPGDVIEIAPDGVNRLVRITEITRSGVNLKIKSVRDDPRLHDPNAAVGPSLDARDEETIFVPAPTKGIAADIPYTRDSENDVNPTLRYAAGAYPSTDWPGAIFWQADNDNDELFPWNTVATENEMTWGVVEDALPAPVTPWMWDRANTIDVTVYGGGTLSNSTEAAINADPTVNQAIVSTVVDGEPAWEIINFASASLLGTANGHNQYRLSTLKRGRRGTEWACEGHAVGDTFVLTSSLLSEGMGLDDIGDELTFKPQSVGRNPVIAPETSLTFTGASLKPYALVIWHVTKESNGDLTIEIRTRTRIGGAWNGTTISTGETIAEYEFDVYDGATFKRTLESTDKTFTYTAADQTTDFGSEITAADLEGFAYQLSATVGRGFERAA